MVEIWIKKSVRPKALIIDMIGTSDSIKNKKFNNKQGTEILEKLLTLTFVHFYFNTNNVRTGTAIGFSHNELNSCMFKMLMAQN